MIYVIFALLTSAAVMSVLAPLAGGAGARDPADADIAFFEEQIAEIERERDEGRLEATEAEAAKTEAARRLLRAQGGAQGARGTRATASRSRALVAALVALVAIPALALTLYFRLGQAALPDMPLAVRLENRPEQFDIASAVARIEAHLKEHPEDGRGFEVIAPYLLRTGRIDEAIHAYGEALRLLGPTATRYADLGEARVVGARGAVPKEACGDFEAALALDPSHPMARYYLGLAAAEDGDRDKAAAIWTKLAADAPTDAAYLPAVKSQLERLRAPPQASGEGPSSEQGKAIAAMPANERQAAIRSMVERLAGRLAQNGDDVEGWLKLIRAYSVLAEAEKAKQALEDARKALAARPAEVERVEALAKELNIGG
jgi:cytochrome c-type biogenesis protein CcmH